MQYYLGSIVNYYKGLQNSCEPAIMQNIESIVFHCNSFNFFSKENSIENEKSSTISVYHI